MAFRKSVLLGMQAFRRVCATACREECVWSLASNLTSPAHIPCFTTENWPSPQLPCLRNYRYISLLIL